MPRRADQITVETVRGTFDRFQALTVTNDLDSASEANFDLGDDGADDIFEIVRPGELFEVRLNGKPRLAGVCASVTVPSTATEGVKIRMVCRTKLADARYCSPDPKIKVENTSIKDFILALYAKLGYTERDFVFDAAADRDLMTGRRGKSKADIIDLAPLKTDQAKAGPQETVWGVAERHLKRFHIQHWDASDGRICVGAPDDDQDPTCRLQMVRDVPRCQANNIIEAVHGADWSEVPSELWVYGQTPGRDIAASTIKGVARDAELEAVFARNKHFYRPVVIPSEQARSLEEANAIAKRELSLRSRAKDTWQVKVDGWSSWNGSEQIPYTTNTVADVEMIGGPVGRYLIHRVVLSYSNDGGCTTQLGLVARGIWAI